MLCSALLCSSARSYAASDSVPTGEPLKFTPQENTRQQAETSTNTISSAKVDAVMWYGMGKTRSVRRAMLSTDIPSASPCLICNVNWHPKSREEMSPGEYDSVVRSVPECIAAAGAEIFEDQPMVSRKQRDHRRAVRIRRSVKSLC